MMMINEDLDKLSLAEASQWLEDHEIAYDHLEKIGEMIELIKIHIKKQQSSNLDTPSNDASTSTEYKLQNSHQFMDDILRKDAKMKAELSQIYEEVIEFVKSDIGDEIRAVIEKRYPNMDRTLRSNVDELNNDECSIVVAGETSAGKSSILNLLLGSDVLPHSLLCATSTICRIHHSESKRLEVFRDGRKEIIQLPDTNEQAGEELKLKLKAIVTGRSEAGSIEYDQVDIYWPLPMLQDRVTIVDTPGIGENTRMTKKLLQYMPNAVAFIYVINSANAGGIQEDKILHIINEQKQWELEGKLCSFNYASTIFVCNKWDMVEKSGEEKQVWDETITKLAAVLPKLPTDQIFKLSALEMSRHRKSGLNDTEKFQALLEGIRKLVPESLKAKVKRHFKWLADFLDKIQNIFRARINHAKDTEEEKMKLYQEVSKRLHTLISDAEKVKEKLIAKAEQQCQKIADELHTFLTNNPSTREKLMTWDDSQIPDIEAGDFEVTKFDAEQIIKKRINEVFYQWETDCHLVQDVSEELSNLFFKECQLLGHACNDVSLMIKGVDRKQDSAFLLGHASGTSSTTENALFSVSEKVILAVAAPLWVPLVTAASILFLPVGVGMLIHESIKAKSMRKDYMLNKVKYMQLWTDQLISQYFTKEHIYNFIMASYFQCFERKINELCLDYIPKRISADRKQIDDINNDKRTAMEISSQFNPMLVKSKGLSDKLRLYELKFITDNIVSLKDIQKVRRIGHGNFADVYSAKWRFQGNNGTVEREIALKITRCGLLAGNSQMDELDCIRKLSHPNIVEFYGICFTSADSDDGEAVDGEFGSNSLLALLLELCEDTLEHKVFNNIELHCCEFKTVPERINTFRFYCKMAEGISSGLSYIHNQGYLHRDLKLSNVLVKDNTAKLCDLGFARLEIALTGTFVGTMTHMSPEMLSNKKYTYSTDMFSLGILLWELWYGRHAYSEVEYMSASVFTIIDAVKTGTRPRCNWKFAMTEEIAELVCLCWNNEPTMRPKAEFVAETIRNIFHKYHKQDI